MSFKQKIYELKHQRAQALEEAQGLLQEQKMEDWGAKMAQIQGFNDQIDACEKMMVESDRFGDDPGMAEKKAGKDADGELTGYEKAVKTFAAAARVGFKASKSADGMMQEGVDTDGGYTVPEDIVTKIVHLREAEESLLDEVTVTPVKTRSGRRTYKKRSQHTGFKTVAEAAKFGRSATPQYATMEYEIEKRGGVLPVTSELMEDSDANITAEAENWLASEARVTANTEILNVISGKAATDLKDLDGILTAWIKLGSSFRATSKLITNDDGLIYLGLLKDANGRHLLTPNPADPKQLRLCIGAHILPVKTYDNATIPSNGTRIPMILGDLKEGVVYWDRRHFSVKVSDVAVVGGLNAFEQDLTLWRGSLRDDCTLRDEDAFINGYIDTAAASAASTTEDTPADTSEGT